MGVSLNHNESHTFLVDVDRECNKEAAIKFYYLTLVHHFSKIDNGSG